MVLLDPEGKGEITGITQMGGEGAQWIGMAPFTDDRHLVQNLGDGTFHHSGSLAVRAAVAAGVNITYKLLYNERRRHDRRPGRRAASMGVPELTRAGWQPRASGGSSSRPRTPRATRASKLAGDRRGARPRASCMRGPAGAGRRSTGVTVLIHDQECAAEERRARKRGKRAGAGRARL